MEPSLHFLTTWRWLHTCGGVCVVFFAGVRGVLRLGLVKLASLFNGYLLLLH